MSQMIVILFSLSMNSHRKADIVCSVDRVIRVCRFNSEAWHTLCQVSCHLVDEPLVMAKQFV